MRKSPLAKMALCMLAGAAQAAEWEHYRNARFRFAIDVAPEFVARPAPDNGMDRRGPRRTVMPK